MLSLYQSHQLEDLADLWLAHIRVKPLASPFAAEKVLVQSKGMGRWLNFRLAGRLGLAANIDYVQPASFFWQLLNQVLGEQEAQSPFAKDILLWRIDAWLANVDRVQAQPVLQSYLAGGDAYRRYALADKLASLFDQYLVYRPEWMNAWAKGKLLGLGEHEHWQAHLWQDLVLEVGPVHRARALAALQEKLAFAHSQGRDLGLPQRISVFGISSLPPIYMDILRQLAEHSHICVFALNPCMLPWGDIRDTHEIDKISRGQDPHDMYLEVGHPLLAKWGKQGRAFLDAFTSADDVQSVFPTKSELKASPPHLLKALQQHILTLSYPKIGDSDAPWFKVRPDDHSIQVHICHSPMREVEVLYDQILHLLAQDANLQPSDIVVLTPDIEPYTPFIHAIFAPQAGQVRIPYAVADRKIQHSLPFLNVLLQLLHLPESRCTVADVFAWLDTPAIAQRFKLLPHQLDVLKQWVHAAGVRWGRDAQHLQALGVPAYPYNTWREGLDRLIMGVAMPNTLAPNGVPLWAGLSPTQMVEGSSSSLLAQLYQFVEVLFSYAEGLNQPRTMADWLIYYQALLSQITDPQTDEDIQAIQYLREQLQALYEQTAVAGYQQLIPLSVFRSSLQQSLDSVGGSSGFLTGGVTFCTLLPMRSLPFKVICVLGLNDGAIPRNAKNDGFDLMLTHPKSGDRSRRGDDRYLFLETLLSARHTLYLSYTGRGIRDNTQLPPSVLLADLLDALTGCAVCESDVPDVTLKGKARLEWRERATKNLLSYLCREHPLQPFNPSYFTQNSRLVSYQSLWLKPAQQLYQGGVVSVETNVAPFESIPLIPNTELQDCSLEDFYRYFSHSARSFLRGVVGVEFPYTEGYTADEEPMDITNFEEVRTMRSQLLDLFSANQLAHASALFSAQGLLPHGHLGEYYAQNLMGGVQHLYEARQAYGEYLAAMPLSFTITQPLLRLHDTLTELTETSLCIVEVGKLYHHTLLNAWFKHLLMCAAAPIPKPTCVIGIDGICEWPAIESTLAAAWLARYADVWQQGQQQALPLFRKSGMVFAKTLWDGLHKKGLLQATACLTISAEDLQALDVEVWKKAVEASRKKWLPDYTAGIQSIEAQDPYIKALWEDIDPWSGELPIAARQALVYLPLYAYMHIVSGAVV